MNWLQEQFHKFNPVMSKDELKEINPKINEFNEWIKDNSERSFDEIGNWGWTVVRLWMHYNGVYLLPTIELNDYLLDKFFPENEWSDDRIDKEVIEICSGKGMLGRMLGIKMTDSMVQANNKLYKEYYKAAKQPTIKYPSDVLCMDANSAVRRLKPHTVIGSYVTWGSKNLMDCMRYGAHEKGPDMIDLYNHVDRIILIGNKSIEPHTNYPILDYPHEVITDVPGLITRSNPDLNIILVWDKNKGDIKNE